MRGHGVVLSAALAALSLVSAAHASVGARGEAAPPVVVAVVDTGVDTTLPLLAGRVAAGYAAAGLGTAASDGAWHGTAIASIVAGLDPQAIVMPVKTLDAAGEGADASIAAGVVWAVDHGARVVNLSLEGTSEAPVLHAALHYASRHGVVVVAAAGNHGTTARTFPAGDAYAIAVAAVQPSGALYPWSNHGGWVTLAAPGVNAAVVPGGGTFDFAGTSSAAAVVSGLVARCLEAAPTLSPAAIRQLLVSTAAALPKQPFGQLDAAGATAACARRGD